MTKAAEQCRVWVEAEFPGTPIGRFACRNTANGGISQHSAYKGYDSNALDIFGPDKSTSHTDQVWIDTIVDTIVADGADKWSIRKILWKDDGRHENHAHIDFYPMITMKKWCGGPETPTWKYERGHSLSTVTTRDPQPQNGLYNGNGGDMQWSDIVDDETWAQAYEQGFIEGNPLWMPQYYQENGVGLKAGHATEDEKKNGYNKIMQAQMEATK